MAEKKTAKEEQAKKKPDVFISYHVKSTSRIVREIAAALEAREIGDGPARRKIICWYSERDMQGGGDFWDIVPQQIETCHVFLLVVDQGALDSVHVERECGFADERYAGHDRDTIKILPYWVEDCKPSRWIKYFLNRIQRIEGIPHTRASMEKLVNAAVQAVENIEKEKKEKEEEEKLSQHYSKMNQELQKKNNALQEEKQALYDENQRLLDKFCELEEKYQLLQEETQTLRVKNQWLQRELNKHHTTKAEMELLRKAAEKSPKDLETVRGDNLEENIGISKAERERRKKIQEEFEQARLIEQARLEQDFTLSLEETVSITVASVGGIIGRGHHSSVYRAELAGSGQIVALKIDYRNLEREFPRVLEKVKALRKIKNDHIQRLIEFVPDWEKNRSYMVLEYIPGETLQKTLYDRRQGGGKPFPQARVLNWALQLLDALDYLHENKLLHGDINLSNIMLLPKKGKAENGEEEHEICLIDFNWSAPDLVVGETRTEIKSDSREGMFFEVSDAEAFRRGILRDIYHVGAVMYQLLTGEVPDTDRGPEKLISDARASDVDAKRRKLRDCGVTDDVAEVILKALSANPNDRYGSAKEMRDAMVGLIFRTIPGHSHSRLILLTMIAAVLMFLAGWSMISVGIYQLGIHNGVKAENSLQDVTHESSIYTLPSVSIENGEMSPHEDVSHQ